MNESVQNSEMGLVAHLLEVRDRILRIVIFLTVIFASLFYFANDIYILLAAPLLAHTPPGMGMVAIDVITPFLTPLIMTMYASLMLGMPYILYHIWAFIAPGLYKHEKRLAVPLLISSIVLFYAGVAFAYYVVFPLVFGFLVNVVPDGVAMQTDISRYLDFVRAMFLAFGFAFEVPVATIILIATGITTADSLVQKRPYIIVGAFVLGMLLTPPDIISQIMLALPMWFLFEVGIIMANILVPPRDDEDEEDDDDEEGQTLPASTAAAPLVVDSEATEEDNKEEPADTEDTPAPQSYSEDAYPDDYEPLSDEEAEAEFDAAEEWEDEDEDEEVAEQPGEDNAEAVEETELQEEPEAEDEARSESSEADADNKDQEEAEKKKEKSSKTGMDDELEEFYNPFQEAEDGYNSP